LIAEHIPFLLLVVMPRVLWLQESEGVTLDGNGTETGQIIVTTIGGHNGKPKQVIY